MDDPGGYGPRTSASTCGDGASNAVALNGSSLRIGALGQQHASSGEKRLARDAKQATVAERLIGTIPVRRGGRKTKPIFTST
jgi:hypothetical protein